MLAIISVTKDDLSGITKTIDSVKPLLNHDAVLYVVDSSQPHIARQVKAYCSRLSGVNYHFQPPAGIAAAFNYGLKHAKEDWIWYLNGGDTLIPGVASDLLPVLLTHSRADMLIMDLKLPHGLSYRPPFYRLWPSLPNWVTHPSTIVRRRVLKEVGGFDETFTCAMDGELWIRIFSREYRIDMLSLPLTLFAPGGLSSDPTKVQRDIRRIIRKHWRLLLKNWLKNTYLTLKIYFTP